MDGSVVAVSAVRRLLLPERRRRLWTACTHYTQHGRAASNNAAQLQAEPRAKLVRRVARDMRQQLLKHRHRRLRDRVGHLLR